MLYIAIAAGLAVLALAVIALARRPNSIERGDHVAPNVLTRINAEYNEHRH
jgi:hypothetical protein